MTNIEYVRDGDSTLCVDNSNSFTYSVVNNYRTGWKYLPQNLIDINTQRKINKSCWQLLSTNSSSSSSILINKLFNC